MSEEKETRIVREEEGDFTFPRPKRQPTSALGKKILSIYDRAATEIEVWVKLCKLPYQ